MSGRKTRVCCGETLRKVPACTVRHRFKIKNNIKVNLQEIGLNDVYSIRLAQNNNK
jgi:hypothetical protein